MIRDVEVGPTGATGLGVFARRRFQEGDFIFRRRHARVVDAAGLARLSADDQVHACTLGPDRFAVVAPPGRFLNHSCEPSAMRHGVVVFAWRRIEAGEEITLDYRLNAIDGSTWPCHCGTPSCRGTVAGGFFGMEAARQALLLPHAPAFVRREHARRRRAQDSGDA